MTTLPLLADLVNRILNALESEYGVNISDEQKVALRAIGATEGGEQWLQYKVLGFVQKQVWPDTAGSEILGGTLERFGRSRLGRNPYPAVPSEYTVTIIGNVGSVLPGQTTVFKSNDTAMNPGVLFVLDNTYTLVSNPDTITLRSMTAGIGSKLAIGDTLTITSPVALVNSIVTVSGQVTQPLAGETLDEYRSAILNSLRLEAQGGAATDYRIWDQDAQAVRLVYPYANPAQSNSINLYVEAKIVDSIDGKGTPSAATLLAVEAVTNFNPDTTIVNVNERGRRPVNVIVNYLPITPITVDVVITGGVFTTSEKANLLTAITAAVNAIRPFVAAADPLVTKNDTLSTNLLNGVIYSAVPGAVYTGVTLKINSVSVLSYTFSAGNIPWFNTLTYI